MTSNVKLLVFHFKCWYNKKEEKSRDLYEKTHKNILFRNIIFLEL